MAKYKCRYCGYESDSAYEGPKLIRRFRQGWTNGLYCSKSCEFNDVLRLCQSMPGHTGRETTLTSQIQKQIDDRWSPEND